MTSPATRTNPARFSTYSGAPSLHPSLAPSSTLGAADTNSARTSTYLSPTSAIITEKDRGTTYIHAQNPASASAVSLSPSDPKAVDIKSWSGALERMQDSRLEAQRFEMNDRKKDEVGKLALGAKVERALARRMVGQDAVLKVGKKKGLGVDAEKRSLEVEAR